MLWHCVLLWSPEAGGRLLFAHDSADLVSQFRCHLVDPVRFFGVLSHHLERFLFRLRSYDPFAVKTEILAIYDLRHDE